MTILVTGGSGLVGARLLPRLVSGGVACRALLRAGKPAPDGATAVAGDLLSPDTLAEAVRDVTAIVHLAAVFRTQDEALIWQSNLDGTRNLIAAAKAHAPTARFIMASTSNIYNADNARPGCEDDVADPKHAYPASKLAAEKELRASGLNWSIIRLPFVYGDRDGHLQDLPKYMTMMKWHPAQRMSTIHHRDVAIAMQLALTGEMDGRVVNVADDMPASIYELVNLAGGIMEPSASPLANPWSQQVDCSLARSLGFRPTVRTVYQAAQERAL